MKYVEFTGKTVDEAVEKGLQELGLTAENADIRVLEEGKKKLFGSIKARVEIAPKTRENCGVEEVVEVKPVEENNAKNTCVNAEGKTDGERTVTFLEGLFELLNINADTELVSEGEKIEINVTAANTTAIIGKHGGMLDAIQTLAGAVANTGRDDYKRVVVDCEDYREKREATLNKLSENLAQKAIRLGKKIMLEPMNPYERRIIHAALSEREGVTTTSEGKEPNRYVVIVPDNLEDPNAPALPARNERDGRRNGGRNDRRNGRGNGRGNYGNRGGRNDRGGRKPMGRKPSAGPTGGTSLKGNNDFFGIFLGNSGTSEDKE
jgi:spoIIIJ-associated protein